jgi:hypothetical protein
MFLQIARQISIVILRCTEERTLCTKGQGVRLIFSYYVPEILRRFPPALQACNTTVLQKELPGRDNIAGIATRYGLNGTVETKFAVSVHRGPETHPASSARGYRVFHLATGAGTWCWRPTIFLRRGCEWVGTIPSPPLFACISISWALSSLLLKNEPRSIHFDVLSDRSFKKSPYHSILYKLNSQTGLIKLAKKQLVKLILHYFLIFSKLVTYKY